MRGVLNLPEEAKGAGLPTGQVEFSSMNPEQFNQLLSWYSEDPSRIAATVSGSGDVPYLPGHQAKHSLGPVDALQHLGHLLRRQHHRQPLGPSSPHRFEPAQVDLQHLLVQEHQRVERLVLRRG